MGNFSIPTSALYILLVCSISLFPIVCNRRLAFLFSYLVFFCRHSNCGFSISSFYLLLDKIVPVLQGFRHDETVVVAL